jgi:hypothetical protein
MASAVLAAEELGAARSTLARAQEHVTGFAASDAAMSTSDRYLAAELEAQISRIDTQAKFAGETAEALAAVATALSAPGILGAMGDEQRSGMMEVNKNDFRVIVESLHHSWKYHESSQSTFEV